MRKVEYVIGAFLPHEVDAITHFIPDEIELNSFKFEGTDIIAAPATPVQMIRKTEQTTKKKNIPANEL